jgi:CHAD domain-containing protein
MAVRHAEHIPVTIEGALRGEDPLLLLAQQTLRREFAAFRSALPETGKAPSAEAIHEMRVALRKLRVALRLFDDFLSGESEYFEAEFRWINHVLGQVRDRDVLEQSLAADDASPSDAKQTAAAFVEQTRAAAHAALNESLASPRFAALMTRFGSFLAQDPPPGLVRRWRSLRIDAAARADVGRSLKRVRKLGKRISNESSPETLHRLRIRAKRLRYVSEFYSAYDPELGAIRKAAKELQDLLGTYRDACRAVEQLRECPALSAHARTAGRSMALDALVKVQRQRAAEARRAYARVWRRFEKTAARAKRNRSKQDLH